MPPKKGADLEGALATIGSEFPTVSDFEREFPSLCFALATGVGKTRLMGAFIAYLHLAHGLNNFFVLAPNLTIYNKLITDFTQNTPKYVLKGISEFAVAPPVITTGENYERLAGLDGLVLIMDESHRYRASAGIRAINELKPVLGLELTATPFVETIRGPVAFNNVIFDYPLGRATASSRSRPLSRARTSSPPASPPRRSSRSSWRTESACMRASRSNWRPMRARSASAS